MTVWISNYAGHDYKAASKYGEFNYITKGYQSFQSLDRVTYTIAEKIAETQKDDWLLISGRPLINIIAALIWLQKHGIVKMLHYDQKGGGTYRELVITAGHLIDMLNVINGAHG